MIIGKESSDVVTSYSFLDTNVPYGTNFYRLKQVNNNGKETFFDIIALNNYTVADKHYFVEVGSMDFRLPYSLYDNKFSSVEIKQENNVLKWEGAAINLDYKVGAEQKKAASAKLLMEFRKL